MIEIKPDREHILQRMWPRSILAARRLARANIRR